ncbi:MAG: biotin--[acetyl-CoA-carboxylase] ligase [Treponema sp.]|nr:biotin--[acetyl-CoA-carboxylase] ligase [Treponema sp.]
MVNDKINNLSSGVSLKNRILGFLRSEPGTFFSGETLALRLGVSRVAVWKHIKALVKAGYPLESGGGGYSWKKEVLPLSEQDDFLYPWEFGERECFFHHLTSTDSTMNRAAEMAARSCPGGTVISAEEQTAGRGRNGHTWVSQKGGLFFTLLERPSMTAAEYFRAALAFQTAAVRSLERLCGKQIRLRWPNDLYAETGKIAGLLTEFHAEGDRLQWISLGLGVNVNNVPYSKATNCSKLAGRPLSRQEVLLAILGEWEMMKKDIQTPGLHKEWNSLAWGIGKKAAAVESSSKAVLAKGTFMGIDEQGRGILKGENQKRFSFNPGSVSFQFMEK